MSLPVDDTSIITNQLGSIILDSDTFNIISSSGELKINESDNDNILNSNNNIPQLIIRILQDIKSFLDTAYRNAERLKNINSMIKLYNYFNFISLI